MTMSKAFYSIIQFCPDTARSEGVNVGVLLVGPSHDKVWVRFIEDNRRAAKVFGADAFDDARLTSAKRALQERLSDVAPNDEALRDFISREASQLVILPLRQMMIREPLQALDGLFHDFVEEKPKTHKHREVAPDLAPYFEKLKGVPLVRNASVEIPVMKIKLHVPYAYRNGAMHYIKPQYFGASYLSQVESLGMKGLLLSKNPLIEGEQVPLNRRLVVVGEFKKATDEKVAKELLEGCEVRLVPKQQVESYLEEIRQSAHE
jgi:hypothetical protein